MNKNKLHPATQSMFFLAAMIGGTAFACVSGFDSPNRILIWIAIAAVLLLRLVGVNWAWSILAGVLILLIYLTWNALITGWLLG